ncbi:MAG: MopE-related protein, partial [Deltaproteobacteria bacterium]|nr:MopE-related protein [Deltaproteobacteria bacterium]
ASAPGKEEVCDGQDTDCDGRVDEGVKNACGLCGPEPEDICNGADDNCDGLTDEGCRCDGKEKRPCSVGECAGIQACTALGTWADECTYSGGHSPQPEICGDGKDNDCDGSADEDFDLGAACHKGEENCKVDGTLVCIAGVADCSAQVDPACVLNVDHGTSGTGPTDNGGSDGIEGEEEGEAQEVIPPPSGGVNLKGGACSLQTEASTSLASFILLFSWLALMFIPKRLARRHRDQGNFCSRTKS